LADKFGSPNRDDPAAIMEQDAEWVAEKVNEFIRDSAEFVLNRPPGNKPVSQEDQHIEWELAMLDPAGLKASFEAYANLVGPENAAAEFLKWDAKHRKMGPPPEPVPVPATPLPMAPPAMAGAMPPMNGAMQ
jgi:hypothetical protein